MLCQYIHFLDYLFDVTVNASPFGGGLTLFQGYPKYKSVQNKAAPQSTG